MVLLGNILDENQSLPSEQRKKLYIYIFKSLNENQFVEKKIDHVSGLS